MYAGGAARGGTGTMSVTSSRTVSLNVTNQSPSGSVVMAFYQFGTVEFGAKQTDLVPAVNAPTPNITERHVPYSNTTILDSGGFGPRRWAITIRLVPENASAMQNLLLATLPLTVAGQVWPNATLIKLDNHQITPRQRSAEDLPAFVPQYHFFDAEWVIGDLPG
jgi:hypothetical protein